MEIIETGTRYVDRDVVEILPKENFMANTGFIRWRSRAGLHRMIIGDFSLCCGMAFNTRNCTKNATYS